MTRSKPKKCKSCGAEFVPRNSLQKVCSPTCAIALVIQEGKKDIKSENRKALKALNHSDRGYATRKAQTAFNAYIRERDKNEPCISCGRHHSGQYHAGHYKTTAAAPELRFNEDNVHKQCSVCNNHMSGNLIAYRARLIEKIGIDRVESLERAREPLKLTIEQIHEIEREYKEKLKALKN